MPSVQGPLKEGSVEKKALLKKMDKLFRLTTAVRIKAKDGSNETITIEHRIGKDAGFFTREHLMEKLGLEADLQEFHHELEKKMKIHDKDRLKEMMREHHKALKGKCNRAVQDYRRYLESYYGNAPRPLLPAFAFVPVNDKTDGLYIQCLLDESSLKLVIGEAADDVLWCEVTFSQTKKFADLNRRAESTAKALMSHPGLNKDLRHRIAAIADGRMPEKLNYNGGDEKK